MWIPITLLAALLQILRTSRQHRLRKVLSVNAAGYVRYVYALPLATAALALTAAIRGGLPTIPWRFWPIIIGGGIAQILGTQALLRAFDLRDFAIGTVYAKTEIIQIAIISTVLLGEPLEPLGWLGAVLTMAGVAWLAAPGKLGDIASKAGDPAAWMGALAGGLFGLAAVGIRGASVSMDGPTWDRALLTLTVMLASQTLINGTQLAAMDRPALRGVFANWRTAATVGFLSVCGSAAWAVAVTLANAAKVRTLGQVELVIAFAISAFYLHERHTRQEYLASALVVVGIVAVVALG